MCIFNFFSSEKFMKICSKTHHLKKFSGKACPRTSLANASLRHVSQAASRHATAQPPKSWAPLGKSYILLWTTTKKFI